MEWSCSPFRRIKEMSIEIKGAIKNTFIDWEGKISLVVFLRYCNLQCPYCYAAKLVKTPEQLPTISKEKVLQFLKE
jgi:pyruvate formate lyase activating enzyme